MSEAPKRRGRPKKVTNVKEDVIQNWQGGGIGLGGGVNDLGFPFNQGTGFSQQVSEVDTGFINLRWYLVSNMRQFLSELYVELGLVSTIVDVPVDDGLRGGVKISSKQLDENQILELVNSLDRDDEINTAGQAEKWNRLYGGAGLLILTDQDPEEPLDVNAINKDTPLEIRAADMWEFFYDRQNTENYDPSLQQEDVEWYNYYGQQVHKSRVIKLKGLTAPSFIRPRLRGWGFSVVEQLIRSINQYLKANCVTFELLDEAKIDVYRIKNLVSTLMSPQGDAKVRAGIAKTNHQKNFQNAIVLDSEDTWEQKQISFAGLSDAMAEIRMQVASDMRMPLTKLFGVSSAGFNSDESSLEVYNSMVESQVRNKLKYPILRICEIKCQKLFGFIPDDLSLEFESLRVLSSEQEENVKTQKFNRLMQAKAAGEITTQEFRDGINKGQLLDITLDTEEDATGGYLDDTISEGANKPYDPTEDTDDPGADRADTRKSKATEIGGIGKGLEGKTPPHDSDPKKILKAKNDLATLAEDRRDKEAYEKAGGAGWKNPLILPYFENPKDKGLWERIKVISKRVYGQENRNFTLFLYEHKGGKFEYEERDGYEDFYNEKLENPGDVDESLWTKAKEKSQEEYGKVKWPIVSYLYEKMGGQWSKKK